MQANTFLLVNKDTYMAQALERALQGGGKETPLDNDELACAVRMGRFRLVFRGAQHPYHPFKLTVWGWPNGKGQTPTLRLRLYDDWTLEVDTATTPVDRFRALKERSKPLDFLQQVDAHHLERDWHRGRTPQVHVRGVLETVLTGEPAGVYFQTMTGGF